MSPNRRARGSRLLLWWGAVAGLYRTAQESADEMGAAKEEIHPTTRWEPRDAYPKGVFLTGVGVLLGLWAIVVGLYPLFNYFRSERVGGMDPAKVLAYIPKQPPHPRNVSDPYWALEQFRAREVSHLNSYRWVDRSKGIVAIPIDRAIQILAQRGIPPSPAGKQPFPPRAGSMRTGLEEKVEPQPR